MPFNISDENIFKTIAAIVAAGVTWLYTITWKNHLTLQKHQLWVVNQHYVNKEELKERLEEALGPIREKDIEHGAKLDRIMEYLYELQKERGK